MTKKKLTLCFCAVFLIISCGTDLDLELKYTVGGDISGLDGTVVLQNNSGDNLTLTSNSSFTFATSLSNGAAYSVTVLTNPTSPDQTCTVSSGSGTISGANITNVSVTCSTNEKIIFLTAAGAGAGGGGGGGNFGGISGADSFCESDSNYPGSGTYKALIVDGTNRVACTSADCATDGESEHVDWVLTKNTPYVKIGGAAINTTNSVGLFDFPLTNAIGTLGNNTYTGLESDWTTGSDCVNWTSGDFNDQGHMGRQNATDVTAINVSDNQNCRDYAGLIYCVEQ